MPFGFANWERLVRRAVLGLSVVLLLTPVGEGAQALEPAAQGRMTPAKRQAVFKARITDIENLFTSGASEDEIRDYVQRLRQLSDLGEASQVDKSARVELLRRKLARVRASMGGAVEIPDDRSHAVYEAMMGRLRKEEESILREISEPERR